MRLLVACPHCNRQYDAGTLAIGQRFHCHCGEVLAVHEPRGHDAAVVCCAHCGGQRTDGALKCEFCGADFTLHERDLDTVCPHCLTRVSHRAKFCHFCGTAIHPEMVAGQETKLACPACGPERTLVSRAWSVVSVLECGGCTGLWLGSESFRRLTDRAAEESKNTEVRGRPREARAPQTELPPPDGGTRYRPCAVCRQLMVKQNYGRKSGVVIDLCRQHGVWFDADELPRVLDWIRSGGLARANEERFAEETHEIALRRYQDRPNHGYAMGDSPSDYSTTGSIVQSAVEILSRWLFRM